MKNFHRDQTGIQTQLATLGNLLKYLDPTLYSYFGALRRSRPLRRFSPPFAVYLIRPVKRECIGMFFCYRWILLLFKREFEIVGTSSSSICSSCLTFDRCANRVGHHLL
jgi:hypothetical protein